MTTITRSGAGVLVGGSLVVLLAACSSSWAPGGAGTPGTSSSTSSSSTSSSSTASASSASSASRTSSVSSNGGSRAVSLVSCTENLCSMTLGGEGAEVRVLGTRISFGGISDGRASVRVGDRSISLTEGQTVSVDGLMLQCMSLTEETVALIGSLA